MSGTSQYVIRFIGQISWDGQANGLPKEIYAFLIYEGDDKQVINNLIEAQATAFVRSQAMFVMRDQGKTIDLRATPADRMLVPMRWIVNITTDMHPLIGELSQADPQGIERLKDGSEPTKQ
jgi:hypothetical protein